MRNTVTMLATLGLLGACAEPPDPDASEKATAEPAVSVTPTAIGGPRHWSAEPPTPAPPTEVTWFKGTSNLPENHPCHDSALVLTFQTDFDCTEKVTVTTLHTLGELRARRNDAGSTGFGPRTVRGVRWSEGGMEKMVVSCDMPGVGMRRAQTSWLLEYLGPRVVGGGTSADVSDVDFELDLQGEPNTVETTHLHVMQRPEGDETWRTLASWGRESNDDESNKPTFVARSRVVHANDSDADGEVEVVAFSMSDCRPFHEENCPEVDRILAPFVIDVVYREGTTRLVDTVFLDHRGRLLSSGDSIERDHRKAAIDGVRAILRQEGKLR